MRTFMRAGIAALVLTLALVPATFAATSNVTDSFSVNGTLTVTGIPATLDYGALDDGTTSAVQTIDANVVSNSPWQLMLTGTDFDRAGGGSLPKSVRQVLLSTTGGNVNFQVMPGPSAWQPFDATSLTDAVADATGSPTAGANVRGEYRIVLPGGTAAGSYSGTITYTFTAT